MSKKYNPADIIEQLKQGSNLVALAMDKLIDSPLGDFSPLSVSLDGYWDKGFPELPIQLQAEVSKAYDNDDPQLPEPTGRNGFLDLADPDVQRTLRDVCRGMGWDLQSPEQRRKQISEWDSRHYSETSAEEFVWIAEQKIKRRELKGEIEKWEGMNTQGIPSEEKIKQEVMDKLSDELAEIEQRLSSRPAAAAEQDALVATVNTNSNDSDVLSKEDALATEIDAILSETPTLKPSKVKSKLLDRIGKQNSIIVGSTSGGLKWENNDGETVEITNKNIDKRIARWKALWKLKNKTPA